MFDKEPDKKLMEMVDFFGKLNSHFQDFLLDFMAKLIKLQEKDEE
jgi:hypothetical protein